MSATAAHVDVRDGAEDREPTPVGQERSMASDAGTAADASSTDVPVIELVEPVPGFPEHRHFALVQLDDDGVLCALRSLDTPADAAGEPLRFLVVPPGAFFPDYVAEIGDETVAALGIEDASQVVVLVIVNPGAGLDDATANLLAPVVVNTANRRAVQVILDADLPVRAPLLAG